MKKYFLILSLGIILIPNISFGEQFDNYFNNKKIIVDYQDWDTVSNLALPKNTFRLDLLNVDGADSYQNLGTCDSGVTIFNGSPTLPLTAPIILFNNNINESEQICLTNSANDYYKVWMYSTSTEETSLNQIYQNINFFSDIIIIGGIAITIFLFVKSWKK